MPQISQPDALSLVGKGCILVHFASCEVSREVMRSCVRSDAKFFFSTCEVGLLFIGTLKSAAVVVVPYPTLAIYRIYKAFPDSLARRNLP